MKQFWFTLIIILILMSCSSQEKRYVIGSSQCSKDIWRDKLNDELKLGTYHYNNVKIETVSANDDDKLQIKQIRHFIDDGVDLLIVSPNQMHSITSIVDRAYDKGIPVILFDRKTDSGKYTAFISADNVEIGRVMGEFIATRLHGRGNVLEIMGLSTSSPAIDRHRGFMEAMKRYPHINILKSLQANWTEKKAMEVTAAYLKTNNEKIDFVFGQNDRMAMGARMALGSKADSVRFCGIDGLATPGGGIELVRDGKLDASYIYPTHGDEVLRLAMNILTHKPYKKENHLKAALVTKDNAGVLLMQNEEMERQRSMLDEVHAKIIEANNTLNRQLVYLSILVILVVLLIAAAVITYRAYLIKAIYSSKLEESNRRQKELTEEMKNMTEAQLNFYTNVSHELRTPLTLIADPVDRMLEEDMPEEENRKLLKVMKRNISSLVRLVNDILEFRKLQQHQEVLQPESFNLTAAVRQWNSLVEQAMSRHGINITINSEESDTDNITADKEKLATVYFCILGNITRYNVKGNVTVNISRKDSRYMWTVNIADLILSDTELKDVFTKFFRSEATTGSTGIRLALVNELILLHLGKVSISSETEHGTEIKIYLPIRQDDYTINNNNIARVTHPENIVLEQLDTPQPGRAVNSEDDNRPTILIMDDNNDVRAYITSILSRKYNIENAVNGKEGLEKARETVPDLVLSDVMMPVMDGLELCRQLKSETATSHIPVILLTARSMSSQQVEGYEQGADAYITKPFESKLLLVQIESLLRNRILLRNIFSAETVRTDEKSLEKEDSSIQKLSMRDRDFIDRFTKDIEDKLADSDLNVETIGNDLNLSRVQLYRKVKALTGCTPVDLLRRARLQRARHLLQTTPMNISEAAYEVGFSSPSYFTKCFKDEYGIQPGEIGK